MMKKVCGSLRQEDDRITNLPEPIRTKVISFLPMEDAIRTSVLSREWRYVTASLPNLEFDQNEFAKRKYKKATFRNIVDRLLLSRERVDVERFNLSVKAEGSTKLHINAWILFAIRNNVREFHLHIIGGSFMGFPCCFFQCSTLVELTLSGLSLEVPLNVCFPKIKRFSLSGGEITNDNLTKSLFLSCPVIEELTLRRCLASTQRTITVSSPSLKILTLDVIANPVTEIKIQATGLQKIEYGYSQLPTISSETVCSLLRADFRLDTLTDDRDCRQHSILVGMHNVATLSLRDFYLMAISRYSNSLQSLPSSCCSLRHLELELHPFQEQANVLLTLLSIYSNLVTLRVSFLVSTLSKYAPYVRTDSHKLISKHLHTVEVKNFEGSDAQIEIIVYLLKNASALEKMKITYFESLEDDIDHTMVSEALSMVTKASACAIILFD